MKKLLLLIALLVPAHADVDLTRLSPQWTPAEPPKAMVTAMEAAGNRVEKYYTSSEGGGGLAYVSRPHADSYSRSSHDGSVAGLLKGFADAREKGGKKLEKNELIRHEDVELVHQEIRQNGFAVCTLTQVSGSGFHQVIASFPVENYSAMLPSIYGLFTSVALPPASTAQTQFDKGYEAGRILAQATYYGFLILLGLIGIGIAIWRWRRWKKSQPPPLP